MPAWVVPAAIAAGGAIISSFQNWRARKINENYVRQQNEYNSPRSQMSRYQAAGLNPNLIYSQGTPGQQSESLRAPEAMSRVGTDAIQAYNSSSLAQSQVASREAQTTRTEVLTQIDKLKAEVISRNPILNDDALNAIINTLKSTADIKASDAAIRQNDKFFSDATRQLQANKIFNEVELLEQKFKLGEMDMKIKASILESNEFKNAILEVQKKFLADKQLGPQQVLEFVKLLLQKIL